MIKVVIMTDKFGLMARMYLNERDMQINLAYLSKLWDFNYHIIFILPEPYTEIKFTRKLNES